METRDILEVLRQFFTGDTLLLAWVAYQLISKMVSPLYKNGGVLKDFLVAMTKALNSEVFSHQEIVVELKALNKILSDKET